MTEKIRISDVDHICVVVSDIDKAVKQAKEILDVRSIAVEENTSTARIKNRELGTYRVAMAMLRLADNLTLEFLQVTAGKSVEQKWLKEHGETMHHFAIKVEDMKKEAKKWVSMGVEILQEDHGKWIYLNTEHILGFNIELVPST
jgi:4-hydroxyphenylpyruvate dioxygenase-like putative hemolysin